MTTRAERRRQARLERLRGAGQRRPVAWTSLWRSPIAVASGLAVGAAAILIVVHAQVTAPPARADLVGPSSAYPPNLVTGSVLGGPEPR
jgi:hypothetical protein